MNHKEPTTVSIVLAELQGADDFRSAKQLCENTRSTNNRVCCALYHLHKHKCVNFISDANGVWWYATPETVDRCCCVDERTPEVKPRKQRKTRKEK